MLTLRDFAGQQLEWKRPRLFTQAYELRSVENDVLATLSYQGNFWRRRVIAEAEGQQWVLKREGFFQNTIAIYPDHGGENVASPLASIKRNWRGRGPIVLADGRTFNWGTGGVWRTTYSVTTAEGMELLQMKRGRRLEIDPAAGDLPELPLLVVLSLYLVLVAEEEAASTAATTAATV